MKSTNLISKFMASAFALFIISASAFAAPVVRRAAGPDINSVIGTVVQFAGDLGGTGNGNGGSYKTGYRVLDWDEVPDAVALGPLPVDFYNTTVPRGMMLSSACSSDDLRVSARPGTGSPLHFGEYDPFYANDFQEFSGPRLFSVNAGGCNYVDVYFYIPGTKTPATVTGFGSVFMDVDTPVSTSIQPYGVDGEPLGPRQFAQAANNGMSFVGVSFNAGERIARVRIFSGTTTLGEPDKSHGGGFDVVVMDSFIYGEPHATSQHSADFDGDGTSDYSVFRPSNGVWYVLQSGSNTVTSTQFGASGDIPVDGDFDGDSMNDQAVFRPSTGVWYVLRSRTGQFQAISFGLNGDKPLSADLDKDGIADIAVWRPSNGNYYYLKSSNGQFASTHFGAAGDIPIGAAAQ